MNQPSSTLADVRVGRFYRWGWLPLTIGCALIGAVVMVGSELAFRDVRVAPTAHVLFVIRGSITVLALSLWVGWYVLRTQPIIDAAREDLLARQRALEVQAGVAACARIVAHELRNPLNTLAIHAELIKRHSSELEPAQVGAIMGRVECEIEKLRTLVDGYMACVHQAHLVRHSPVQLEPILRGVIAAAQPMLDAKHLAAIVDAPAVLPCVDVDADQIAEAVQRIVRHACNASPQGGTITCRLRDMGSSVSLAVEDGGPELESPSVVFKPFFVDAQSGFALAIVRDIVRAHGGVVRARNEEHGRSVVMSLPVAV